MGFSPSLYLSVPLTFTGYSYATTFIVSSVLGWIFANFFLPARMRGIHLCCAAYAAGSAVVVGYCCCY